MLVPEQKMPPFTYMGTKKRLAEEIGAVCAHLPDGPFFDLFSGISAAGAAVSRSRQVWCNDVQHFSNLLTRALYTSNRQEFDIGKIASAIHENYQSNKSALEQALGDLIADEKSTFSSDNADFINLNANMRELVREKAGARDRSVWCLFSRTYPGTYVGLAQAVDLDSIKCGIDKALQDRRLSVEDGRWALLALCKALMGASNSTGHFAQYLSPSLANAERVLMKRRRCVYSLWLAALGELRPTGEADWRAGNRVFSGDANEILQTIMGGVNKPGIVYADPPYTNDQYSRYYHLLETLIIYDYPQVTGKGLYRPNRFSSPFSLKGQVDCAFHTLIERSSIVGKSLVISYPSNGLMKDGIEKIPSLMSKHFGTVNDPLIVEHQHSTMGGSKGPNKESVEEIIFVASHG